MTGTARTIRYTSGLTNDRSIASHMRDTMIATTVSTPNRWKEELSGIVDASVVCWGSERGMAGGGAYCLEAGYLFGEGGDSP